MKNLFKLLDKHAKNCSNDISNKPYWEQRENIFNSNALSPDGTYVDEQAVFESIKQSDRERLIRFS